MEAAFCYISSMVKGDIHLHYRCKTEGCAVSMTTALK